MFMDFEACHGMLLQQLQQAKAQREVERVLTWSRCEIDPTFLCFAQTYLAASLVAPAHFQVVDLGCNQGVQAAFFRRHAGYLGVDASVPLRWRFRQANARHVRQDAKAWLNSKACAELDVSKVFAVVSYVPDEEVSRLARARFPNILAYYPSSTPGPTLALR